MSATYSGSDKRIKHLFDEGGGGGGGSTTLAGLSDVSLSSPSDGQVLKFDNSSNKWKNQNESGGGSTTLAGLSDVAIASQTNGQALIWDATNQKWINASVGGGGGSSAIDTLWTNSSPTSSFGAETISISGLLNYDLVGIVFREGTSWTQNIPIQWMKCYDTNYTVVCVGGTGTANTFIARTITIDGNSLVFSQGFRPGVGYYDTYLVPYQILGMKLNAGGGGGSSSHEYSTTEHEVGTWIDDKTIYEKTWQLSMSLSSVSWWRTAIPIDSIEKTFNGMVTDVNGQSYHVDIGLSDGYVYIRNYDSIGYTVDSLTFQYTKSTPAPAGDWEILFEYKFAGYGGYVIIDSNWSASDYANGQGNLWSFVKEFITCTSGALTATKALTAKTGNTSSIDSSFASYAAGASISASISGYERLTIAGNALSSLPFEVGICWSYTSSKQAAIYKMDGTLVTWSNIYYNNQTGDYITIKKDAYTNGWSTIAFNGTVRSYSFDLVTSGESSDQGSWEVLDGSTAQSRTYNKVFIVFAIPS